MQNFMEYAKILKRKINVSKEETIFVCIGTNRVIWDSIGPYVGSYLKKKIGQKYVIGDLKSNICCKEDFLYYYPKIKNKFIVAIDSAIAENELQGEIFITENPIVMGLGVSQYKGIIGNIGIKASINKKITSKKYIKQISRNIANGIEYYYKY